MTIAHGVHLPRIFGGFGAALLLLAVSADQGGAQVAIEARIGASVGNHAPAAAGLELLPGLSYSLLGEVTFRPRIAFYATYTHGAFGCEEGFCAGGDVQLFSDAFGAGVRFLSHRRLWARAGLLYHGAFVQTTTGIYAVDRSPGYELSAGYALPVNSWFHLVTGAGYRSHFNAPERTSVLNAEAGVRVRVHPIPDRLR